MTTYQILCCVRSPNWFNYQNPLASEFDYFKEKIAQNLPLNAVDSYLGRLIDVAKVVNESIEVLDQYNFKYWLAAMEVMSKTTILSYHKPSKQMLEDLQKYFDCGLPAEFILPLLKVSILQLHTRGGEFLNLNAPEFLDCLRQLRDIKFTPLVLWFGEHSHAVSEDTLYQEVG